MKTIFLDEEQVETIAAHLPADAWLPLWIAAETGMRIGDVVSLKRSSICGLEIHYTAQKTGKDGVAAICAELGAAIARFTARSRRRWLFPSPKNPRKHLTRQACWYRVKRACENAGVDPEGIAPHSFRKYFAVKLYREKGLKAVQNALQHDRATTTEIYALSDFSTGKNAKQPLLRRDLQFIIEQVTAAVLARLDKM